MLKIQQIIAKEKLQSVDAITSYFLDRMGVKVKHHAEHGLLLFMYDLVHTDFSIEGASECRGTILRDIAPHEPVCVPFFKFFNVDEPRAAKIDWSTARVYEKLDGSIMKVYFHSGEWLVATNGTIDSRTTPVFNDRSAEPRTFFDLFLDARPASWSNTLLNKDCTYMFELLHPMQLIVIEHAQPRLVHIGTRNNKTLVESYEPVPLTGGGFIEQAQSFSLRTRGDCIAAAAQLGAQQEGFVVVDGAWSRVKIKSPIYVSLHHSIVNGTVAGASEKELRLRAAEIFLHGETEEVRSYRQASARFAEISQKIDEIDIEFTSAASRLDRVYAKLRQDILQGSDKENRSTNLNFLQTSDRKQFAMAAQKVSPTSKTSFNFLMQGLNGEIADQKIKPFAKILLEKFSNEKSSKAMLQFMDEVKTL